MKNQLYTISLSFICFLSLLLTFQYLGWMGILFSIPFLLCAIFQILLLWGVIDFDSKYKKYITILSIALIIMFLGREDFTDAHISTTFILNYLFYKLVVISNPFYENSTGLSLLNFLWFLVLPAQITLLILLRKEKKKTGNTNEERVF